jgi:DNA (cytosine-5)-methyltransferase 1
VRHLDLFSGIGGFALAAHRVGWETVLFCEPEPFCKRILRARFGGYGWLPVPGHFCSGEPEWVNRIEELSWIAPDWLVVENDFHRWRAWMPELRRRLHERGYSSLPLRVQAAEVGAVHLRARGWLVANADSEPLRELSRWWRREGGAVAQELAGSWDSAPRRLGTNDGLPDWVDRRHALGNAIVPRAAELIFRGISSVISSDRSE